MVDSHLEIGSAASGQISAKAFEKHIEVGGGRVGLVVSRGPCVPGLLAHGRSLLHGRVPCRAERNAGQPSRGIDGVSKDGVSEPYCAAL